MFFWSKETAVTLGFIQPGKPSQKATVKSLNDKFRNKCLNRHWFRTMDEARAEIDAWRDHYNHVRPHSSLNYLPLVEFAQRAAYVEAHERVVLIQGGGPLYRAQYLH